MAASALQIDSPATTWTDLLRHRAATSGNSPAYIFLADGEEQELSVTYAQLDQQARAVAAALQQAGVAGGRALLLYPPGLEFINGLLGCWYAGVVAVPAYPPRSAQHPGALATLRAIAQDAQPSVVLTVGRLVSLLKTTAAGELDILSQVPVLATDEIAPDLAVQWNAPELSGDTLACLQYTSGSTSAPKGVMLTHANLLFNSKLIGNCFGHSARSRGVIWLPPYHDMGLIGGILQPMYIGLPVTLMAPAAFLQRPLRWLKAISRNRATTSGGPNFAYELCARQIREEDRKSLDLSTWEVAFCGAEPIDHRTLDRFAEVFAPCGFRREAFYPCYGLAEATLLVSGGKLLNAPIVRSFSAAALAENRAVKAQDASSRMLVGCGEAQPAGSVRIVDPQTRAECAAGSVGEIWVSNPGVAKGYWQKPAETKENFCARIADSDQGPFLRTGDLGFLDDSELFITGRLKDLIIIRGRNHYPQDIEQTAQASHPALRPGGGAAFSVRDDVHERLVVVHEIERTQRNVEPQQVIDAIRQQIAAQHELQVSAVVLLMPGKIAKTSSGKVRRQACRASFLSNELEPLAKWEQPIEAATDCALAACPPAAPPATVKQMEALILEQLAAALKVPTDEIDPCEPFARYGLDSAGAVELAGKLETTIGRTLPATLFYDYPTVRELAGHLFSEPASPVA